MRLRPASLPNPLKPRRPAQQHCLKPGCQACWVMRERGLTLAEVGVVSLLCMGMGSDKQLSAVLGITKTTARKHCWNIGQKLGQDDRLNIALWAIHNGLWETPAS